MKASLSSPRYQTQMRPQRPLPTSPGRGPHFPDPSDPPATRKGGSATPGAAIPPDPPLPRNGSARGRAKGPAKRAEPAAEPVTTGVLSNTARHRNLCTKSSVTSAAPRCDAWDDPQDPEPRPATGLTTTTQRRTAAQHTPATPDGRTNRRDGRQPAQHMQQMSGEWGLAFAARGVKHERKPHVFLLQPPGRGPRFPDPATNLQQGKGRRDTRIRPPTSPSSPVSRIHKGPGKGPGQTRGTRGRADNHKNVNERPARVLPSRARIRGYVHRGDRRAPPPGKLNAWDAQGYGTYNLCEWYGGHTSRRQLTASIRGRGLQHCPVLLSSKTPPGACGGPQAHHTGTRRPPASGHGCVTPSPTHHIGPNVPTPQHKPNHPNHPSHHTQHRDTGTPAE